MKERECVSNTKNPMRFLYIERFITRVLQSIIFGEEKHREYTGRHRLRAEPEQSLCPRRHSHLQILHAVNFRSGLEDYGFGPNQKKKTEKHSQKQKKSKPYLKPQDASRGLWRISFELVNSFDESLESKLKSQSWRQRTSHTHLDHQILLILMIHILSTTTRNRPIELYSFGDLESNKNKNKNSNSI